MCSIDFNRLLALYKNADVCVVSSLHEGMNLVAKEFVAANTDNNAALVLSKFAGAAREMDGAIVINPYDVDEFADAIKYALEMPKRERQRRMKTLRGIVRRNDIYRWLWGFLTEIATMAGRKNI